MKNKRGATSISILLLVVMALVLSATALLVFNSSKNKTAKEISNARIVEDVYVKEEKINFLAKNMKLEDAVKLVGGASIENGKIKVVKEEGKIKIIYEFEIDKEKV